MIAHECATSAAERLAALGADVTIDVVPQLAHGISAEVLDLLVERLAPPVAERHWADATADTVFAGIPGQIRCIGAPI